MTIYGFKNFNNYYNRQLKGENITNISDFMDAFGEYDYMQTDTFGNFNENDGVYTDQVLGTTNNPYHGSCDYLLVCYDNNDIDSRWFIIDQNKKCFGQYKLTLYRDTLADYWDQVKEAPMLIEKATLSADDPLIFNKENITTNQIKKDEILLQDESKLGWIVGYLDKDYGKVDSQTVVFDADVIPDMTIANESDLATTVGAARSTTYSILKSSNYKFDVYVGWGAGHGGTGATVVERITLTVDSAGNVSYTKHSAYPIPAGVWTFFGHPDQLRDAVQGVINTTTLNNAVLYTYSGTYANASTYIANIRANNGKIVHVTNGNVDLKIQATFEDATKDRAVASDSAVYIALSSQLNAITHTGSEIENVHAITNDSTALYQTSEIDSGQYKIAFGRSVDRLHCKDVFDMFCIPYPAFNENGEGENDTNFEAVTINNSSVLSWTPFSFSAYDALTIAQGLAKSLGANLYDLQLLPYCPISTFTYNTVSNKRVLDINSNDTKRYRIVTNEDGTAYKGVIFFSASNKGTFNISASTFPTLSTVGNAKIINQTQIIRLSSPNYSAQFDFNVAKNKGVSSFNIDYTYLPYRPYIHVAPVWNQAGIYGKDFNDAKGLICGGDFSVSYLSDAWINYQINNKNFQEIFDRGTQNLETTYKYQRLESVLNGVVGATTGTVAGAAAGGSTPLGPIGAGIGALVGGALSAGGMIADLAIQKDLHNEAMDYRSDLFQLQLDNIRALPQSLTKVTAINENNKIFPFIEIYDCTDREKEAVANQIRWSGMTVGVVGKINDYLPNSWSYNQITDKGFIKGKLIRIENVNDDTHVINAIADELNKGVYTK